MLKRVFATVAVAASIAMTASAAWSQSQPKDIKWATSAVGSSGHKALVVLANVLNSERAAQTSVLVVRAFVRLRQLLSSNTELARKLEALERKYDTQFKVVFDAIRQLMSPVETKRKEIGFHVKHDNKKPKARKR